jgi:hypothetical protein
MSAGALSDSRSNLPSHCNNLVTVTRRLGGAAQPQSHFAKFATDALDCHTIEI